MAFVIVLPLSISVQAQTAPSENKPDTTWATKLYHIAERQPNLDTAIRMFKDILQVHIHAKDSVRIQGTYLKLGEEYCRKGDYATALAYSKQALHYWAVLSILEKANYYEHISQIYIYMGDYVTASKYAYTALEYVKRMNQYGEADHYIIICSNLGLINSRLHQNDKALYYLNDGTRVARENKKTGYIAVMLLSKGDFYNEVHQPDSAKKYYAEAIKIGEEVSSFELKAEANMGLGVVFIELKEYEKAIGYLRTAISIARDLDKNVATDAYYYLGDALYQTHQYKEAETVLVTALKQATQSKYNNTILKGYTTLTAIYKATGQYRKALACMDNLSILKDSLVSAEKAKAINLMDAKFQTAEKDKQIAQQARNIARKNMWIIVIGSSIILLLLIFAGTHLQTRHKLHLDSEYVKSLERENKIGILKAVVLGGDNERSRIARELHDGIGGMLSAAMMRFSAMPRENKEVPELPSYQEGMNILNGMGEEIRKTAHNLMPDVLLKQSLPDAIRTFCNSVQESGALQIGFQSYGSFDDLSQNYKLNLYRIVQELIRNILQHARANKALVQLLHNESTLIVSVEDDGVGFNMHEIKSGIGLYNAQTRVSSLDGQFTLESTPGKGTSVFIEFKRPLAY